jgi:hypothetical protein
VDAGDDDLVARGLGALWASCAATAGGAGTDVTAPALLDSGSVAGASGATTGAVSLQADHLHLLVVRNSKAGSAAEITALGPGLGKTWNAIATVTFGGGGFEVRLTVLRATDYGAAGPGTITIIGDGTPQISIQWQVLEKADVDTSGPGFRQAVAASSGGADVSSLAAVLGALGSNANTTLGAAASFASALGFTPPAGFAELGEVGDILQSEWSAANAQQASVTIGAATKLGVIAVELANSPVPGVRVTPGAGVAPQHTAQVLNRPMRATVLNG